MLSKVLSFLVHIFNFFFKKKTFIIVTKNKTKSLAVSCFTQFLFVAILATTISYFCIKYNQYKNYNNYAVILEENNNLKTEHKKLRQQFAKYDKKAEKINEYLTYILTNKDNLKIKKPKRKDYKKISFDNMIGQLKEHELYAYAAIEERRKDIKKTIKKLGISNIFYDKLVKTAQVSQKINSNQDDYVSNVASNNSVGGVDEPVEKIEIVKDRPILQISNNKITEQNFQTEIDKEIAAERMLNSLPFGAPTNNNYRITSTYGFRRDPIKKSKKLYFHKGIDMVISNGKILSPKDGIVKFAGHKKGYGKYVEIEHNSNNITTHYAHLDKIFVKKGQEIKKNDIIGIQGNTGRSTGEHLHYEIRINKQFVNPIKFFIKKNSNV